MKKILTILLLIVLLSCVLSMEKVTTVTVTNNSSPPHDEQFVNVDGETRYIKNNEPSKFIIDWVDNNYNEIYVDFESANRIVLTLENQVEKNIVVKNEEITIK